MIIWMFNHYAITPDYPGGTRHFELGKNLAEGGHKVVIFASNFIHMNFTELPVGVRTGCMVENHGDLDFIWVETRQYRENNWRRLGNMMDYRRMARKTALRMIKEKELEKPDVIIGSTVHPFAPLMAASLAKKFKVPFIFEIRDLWPETFIDMGVWKRTSPQARLFKWIEKRSVSKARKIIALSPRTQAYLEEHYNYSPDDTVYIPNGVYLDGGAVEDLPDEDETIARLETLKREGASVVLFSGSLIATNKLETIIEAAALLKEEEKIKIVLIGKGQEEEKYRGLIRDRGLENILILPPVRKDRVPALLHRADLLILNQGNVQWGSSNKLYDYMASGRPIISSVHAQHNDIVAQVEGGLSVAPEDPNALETAVRRLAGMPEEEKEAMGKRNREYVEKHHDWKLLAGRLMEMAEGVVK